jgi:hypothetical protein
MLRLILTALLACASMPAHANSITGYLRVYPDSEFDPATGLIEFYPGSPPVLSSVVSGSFVPYAGAVVVAQNPGMEIPFSALGTTSNLGCGSTCLFLLADNLQAIGWLNVTSINDMGWTYPNGTPTNQWLGTGTFSLTGYDPTPGTFEMFVQGPGDFAPGYNTWTSISWNPNPPAHAPGPIVGTGLVPFLLGLFGINWLRRRKLKAAQP